MEDQIAAIISQILDVSPAEARTSAPESLAAWDSLAHLSIVVSLEDAFQITFEPDEINEMLAGYPKILALTQNRLNEKKGYT